MPSTARWGIIFPGYGRQQNDDDRQHGADHHDRHVVVGARHDHHRQHSARLGFREIGVFGWPSTDDDPAAILRAGKPRCREISSYPRSKHLVCCSCRDHGPRLTWCVNSKWRRGIPLARFEQLTLNICVDQLYARRNKMVAAAHELPASGCALEVDGRFKAEFATRDGAKTGAEELKKRFPMLRIRIYDAETETREEVQLPPV